MPEVVQVASSAEEPHSVDGIEGQLLVDEHGDLVPSPVPHAESLRRGEAAEQGARAGMLKGHPEKLFAR